jgi:predicted RNase H-like nuclease (RuvC/YqgF family)
MRVEQKLLVLVTSLTLFLSFPAVSAENMTLEEANEKIELLKSENESLKTQLGYFEKEIAAYRKKLEAFDEKETDENNED